MTTKSYTAGILCVLLTTITGCTKAVIDEGQTTDLPPIDKTVTYKADVSKIMTNYCITCHAGAAPSAGLDLSTYNGTKNSAQNGSLVSRMNNTSNPMPPSGVLSPKVRQLIDKWVADGFPEE